MRFLGIISVLLWVHVCVTHGFTAVPRISPSAFRLAKIRGGSVAASTSAQAEEVQVTVRSAVGSRWLDKHCTLRVGPATTVQQLREHIQKAFLGNPPAKLQRLFLDSRLLKDNERVGDLGVDATGRVTLKLDWVPLSTVQYSMAAASVDEMLSATVSLRAAIQFANHLASTLTDDEQRDTLLSSPEPITKVYQKQVEGETNALPEVFKAELAAAYARQADPVEHLQYDENAAASMNAATKSVLKFVILEKHTIQRIAMLSLFFIVSLLMRTENPATIWIGLLPFLQLFRPVRYWAKVARYLIPPLQGPQLMFFQPLLSPSDVSISQWSGVWTAPSISDSTSTQDQSVDDLDSEYSDHYEDSELDSADDDSFGDYGDYEDEPDDD